MQYTATITRNFRDVHTTSPKVLLCNIIDELGNEFRDHCWVPINKHIESVIPKSNRYKQQIQFKAKEFEYQTRGPKKSALSAIKQVVTLG